MTVEGGPPGAQPSGASRDDLLAEVARALDDVPEGAAAVVAVSGGPDSTALAYLVAEARGDLRLTLGHVRHGLRDDTGDVEVVRRHAGWLGLPLEVREVEVTPHGEGLEAAARRVRYAALRDIAAAAGAEAVLVGHTADDQAETLLLRLARGTGVDGLAGMRRRSGDLLRPLLRLRRADVHRHLLLEGLPSVTDPQNLDPGVRRSVVRERVLPALADVGPDPVGALARLADLAHDDAEALAGPVAEVLEGARRFADVVAVERDVLARVPVGVARRAVRSLVAEVGGGQAPPAAAVERVLALAAGAACDLPGGVRASAGGGWLALAPPHPPDVPPLTLRAGERLDWPAAGVALRWHGADDPTGDGDGARQIALALPAARALPAVPVPGEVIPPGGTSAHGSLPVPEGLDAVGVRPRRTGDRIRRRGGTRRLQDLLVDVGVPRPLRPRWPVVTVDDRPVWVPGVATDRDLLAAARSAPAGLIALERARTP